MGEMIKAPVNVQELRRRIYRKAKSDKAHRFWGIFVHITKIEVLKEAYRTAKRNGGVPGIDRQRFDDIEANGLETFLVEIRDDLRSGKYQPQPNRRVDIPKSNGKTRTLQIPCIRDRVVQGALKLILEAIFEADFCRNSYGFRPKRSPHLALAEVRRSVLRRMSIVIDVDLSKYFDTIRHSVLLEKIAKRVQDPQVMHLVKQIIKVGGKIGVPQGGPFSPLAANIYLNEVDWTFDAIRRKTAEGNFEAVNYHRFADDMVITVNGHYTKIGWAERALQRLQEQLVPLGVELNREKTKMVDTLKDESFGFLGFDLRRARKRHKDGYFILMTPKKKARSAVKARIREIICNGGATPVKKIVADVNGVLAGWVNYFRVGNASGAFSEVRSYTEMKIRTLLTRRKRRTKRGIGWRRWSSVYLYDVLGLYRSWELQPLPSVEQVARK
jgi:group II intron reverse transcriptase/maturase